MNQPSIADVVGLFVLISATPYTTDEEKRIILRALKNG